MIALCPEHHAKADGGSWTPSELHDLKAHAAAERSTEVRGRFDWMRQDMILVMGNFFYHEQPVAVQIGTTPVVWYTRDSTNRILWSVRMPTTSGQRRLHMDENDFVLNGHAEDLECPPNGRKLSVSYPNGDFLGLEFFELTAERAASRYPQRPFPAYVTFPITAVEVALNIAKTGLSFGPTGTKLAGGTLGGGWLSRNGGAGILISQTCPDLFPGNSHPPRTATSDKTPRNAPCPCGSGKKFKKCHGFTTRDTPSSG